MMRITCLLPVLCALALSLCLSGPAQAESTLRSNHLTWTMRGDDHKTGKFVNGDPWIVGPITITDITNDLNSDEFEPKQGQNGSMVNPLVGHKRGKQGYDSTLSSYKASLNAGRPHGKALSAQNPLHVKPGSTLISMVSWLYNSKTDKEEGAPRISGRGARPATRAAGVLTVLDQAPPKNSFRPPYAGDDKTVKFQMSDLDRSKLRKLDPVPNTPDPKRLAKKMDKTWIDHAFEWYGAYIHPSEHMPNYGRDMANIVLNTALMLNLDFEQLPGSPSKDHLLINLVQYGIDSTGIADNGGGWRANGGHGLGRKLPILFAGALLNDQHMLNAGHWSREFGKGVEFQEDQQHFYVTEEDVKRTHSDKWSPDHRNVENGTAEPYTKKDIGMAEWGIRHAYRPQADNRHVGAKYRGINSGITPGFALVARLMGLESNWNHPAFFDYADRYMKQYKGGRDINGKSKANSMNDFPYQMWTHYADQARKESDAEQGQGGDEKG